MNILGAIMAAAILLLGCQMPASPKNDSFADGLELTYAIKGAEKATLRATFTGKGANVSVTFTPSEDKNVLAVDGRTAFGMGFDGLASQVRNLPLWLPAGARKIGTVVYDDGEGFKHDKGKEIYTLQSSETWKGFDAVGLSYGYQGMQQHDNWRLEACYDTASGFLLSATVSTAMSSDRHVTFELTLAASTDPGMKKKLQ